jgi:hypothetical protein
VKIGLPFLVCLILILFIMASSHGILKYLITYSSFRQVYSIIFVGTKFALSLKLREIRKHPLNKVISVEELSSPTQDPLLPF